MLAGNCECSIVHLLAARGGIAGMTPSPKVDYLIASLELRISAEEIYLQEELNPSLPLFVAAIFPAIVEKPLSQMKTENHWKHHRTGLQIHSEEALA